MRSGEYEAALNEYKFPACCTDIAKINKAYVYANGEIGESSESPEAPNTEKAEELYLEVFESGTPYTAEIAIDYYALRYDMVGDQEKLLDELKSDYDGDKHQLATLFAGNLYNSLHSDKMEAHTYKAAEKFFATIDDEPGSALYLVRTTGPSVNPPGSSTEKVKYIKGSYAYGGMHYWTRYERASPGDQKGIELSDLEMYLEEHAMWVEQPR